MRVKTALAMLGFIAMGRLAFAADAGRNEALEALVGYRFNEAAAALENVDATSPREWALLQAAVLLNREPKSETNVQQAKKLLSELPAKDENDRIALTARYLLARIAQVHQAVADVAEARTLYRSVLQHASPGDSIADQSAVKLALLILYEPGDRQVRDRMAEAESLDNPGFCAAARRDLHLAIAKACLFHDGPRDQALHHLEFALRLEINNPKNKASIQIAAAQLNLELGHAPRGRELLEQYLAEFPRDSRANAARALLAQLP